MIPKKCSLCKGELKQEKTEFTAKMGDRVISITNLPAYVCTKCGEAYFTPQTSRKIDKVMKQFSSNKLPVHPIIAGQIDIAEISSG